MLSTENFTQTAKHYTKVSETLLSFLSEIKKINTEKS